MRTLKVILVIVSIIFAIFGLLGLFVPSVLISMDMAAKGSEAFTRVVATSTLAWALAAWYAFRDPAKNVAITRAIITWLGLEGLVLLISGIGKALDIGSALPGVIFDWILAVLLFIFNRKVAKAA